MDPIQESRPIPFRLRLLSGRGSQTIAIDQIPHPKRLPINGINHQSGPYAARAEAAAATDSAEPMAKASRRSLRGLDWFAFFVADIQAGWGPFVAAYLTTAAWTQFDIGLILTIGTLAALLLQIPAGALVDNVPAKRSLAALAVACISGSALLLALWPLFRVAVVAKLLHAMASCLLGPTLAAISLGLVGYKGLSIRLGRNARYLSLGNAIAAGVMGGVGYAVSNQAIFLLTAALATTISGRPRSHS